MTNASLPPRVYEGGAPVRTLGRGEYKYAVKKLPQSKIGSEEPIFDSPLINEGAEGAPHSLHR